MQRQSWVSMCLVQRKGSRGFRPVQRQSLFHDWTGGHVHILLFGDNGKEVHKCISYMVWQMATWEKHAVFIKNSSLATGSQTRLCQLWFISVSEKVEHLWLTEWAEGSSDQWVALIWRKGCCIMWKRNLELAKWGLKLQKESPKTQL
jgi:hypothetical protein